jgi:hypothetical protein
MANDLFFPETDLDSTTERLRDAPVDAPNLFEISDAVSKTGFLGAVKNFATEPFFEPVEGFNASSDQRLSETGKYASELWRFGDSESQGELDWRIARFEEETKAHKVLGNAYGFGGAAALTMDVTTDPLSYVPLVGWGVKGAKWTQRAAQGTAVSFATTVPYEAFMHSNSETRTLGQTLMTVGAMTSLTATTSAIFGKRISSNAVPKHEPLLIENKMPGTEPKAKSVGASAKQSWDDLVNEESLIETGTKIEDLPLNPILRLFNHKNPTVTQTLTDLADTSGLQQNKIKDQIPQNNLSVEVNVRSTYLKPMFDAIKAAETQYLKFRGVVPKDDLTSNVISQAKLKIGDAIDNFGKTEKINPRLEFNQRVGRAMARNDIDIIKDKMTPYVEAAAKEYRNVLNITGKNGMEVDLFGKEAAKSIEKLEVKLAAAEKKVKNNPNPTTAEMDKVTNLTKQLESAVKYKEKLRTQGLFVTGADSFFPRVYDVPYMLSEVGQRNWMNIVGREIGLDNAKAAYHRITNTDAFGTSAQRVSDSVDEFMATGTAQGRVLALSNDLLDDFLEHNVEYVIRQHVRAIGTDIELTRKFGDVSMSKAIDDAVESVTDPAQKASVKKDLEALRDIQRGTYGHPDNPNSLLSQGADFMKSFNILTMMGGAAVSSIPDIGRIAMTEGLNNFFGTSLKAFQSDFRSTIIKMNRSEINEVGEALDMVLAWRALQMADAGSPFGRTSQMARIAQDATGPFFLLNGLNLWNTTVKEWAGLVITQRMHKSINTDWQKLSISDRDRLLVYGIDGPMASRINSELKKHGKSKDGFSFANVSAWDDPVAAITYKNAVNASINRTIVTPGSGDRALWTSTHYGSLITQFKSFGQASTQRVLISGLQERNKNFWHGAGMMVALALGVNEIKRMQYGMDNKRTFGQVLWEGVERSGLPAIFTDFNHALETITNNKISMDAVTGGNSMDYGYRRWLGELLGPTGSQIGNVGNIIENVIDDDYTESFYDSLRSLTPYNNNFAFDPAFDAVYGP